MAENKVGYSRAGDTFHYRWAARRALKLIYPNADLSFLVIEGSNDILKAGEYVIDVSEYYGDQDEPTKIIYFQLKHTTVQKNKPFVISDLKGTFEGFAEKFREWHCKNEILNKGIQFTIVTNRPFSEDFKQNLLAIISGNCTDNRFIKTISTYTKLNADELKLFCSILTIEDAEVDYKLQKQELRIDIARLIAGTIENIQVSSLTTLISEKVLPDSDGKVYKENVLKCFGFQSENELYPAKPIWDPQGPIVKRNIYTTLSTQIFSTEQPMIVHAPGGVGKSVFTRYLMTHIIEGSEVIAYDCFGAGSYRNRSQSRHRHRDAFVEIINELAAKGLCDPMLVQNGTHEVEMIRTFMNRIESAIKEIRSSYKDSILLLLIDAADNAEMAAREMNDICFAGELLREKMPDGCKLVYLCRPERIHLLSPQSNVVKFSLDPFSREETMENLCLYFPSATISDAEEFHRLTAANPRIQAMVLSSRKADLATLLADLGPSIITVETQIENQLEHALNRVKDNLPKEYHQQLNNICIGLATLSPNIPIEILAKVAGVEISTVKSFIADIGRSLWQYDDSVRFRDEPSETWFRDKFIAEKNTLDGFISTLESLTVKSNYAAEVLPQLYLEAQQYKKLISLALSDDYLPIDSPIDQRNIRVYRLQFALKAALKLNQVKDACKLALRAGEEMAGNQRQTDLLISNIDLLVKLQSKEKIQQIALRRELSGLWEGSENIYSASLLSQIKEFNGEARSFLRSAENWLTIYFKTPKEPNAYQEDLKSADLLEFTYAHLNLNGVNSCLDFLFNLKPKSAIAKIFGLLIKRLVDMGEFVIITELLSNCKKEHLFLLEANNELTKVGKFCAKDDVEFLINKILEKPINKDSLNNELHDRPDMSIIGLAEAAIYYGLSSERILKLVNTYLPSKVKSQITRSIHRNLTVYYLRSLAIRHYLGGYSDFEINQFLPTKHSNKKMSYDQERELTNYKEILGALIPWYIVRLEIIKNEGKVDLNRIEQVAMLSEKNKNRYFVNDPLPEQLALAYLEILKHSTAATAEFLKSFFNSKLRENKDVLTRTWIASIRWSFRMEHLFLLKDELEAIAYNKINSNNSGSPEDLAFDYVTLARAVSLSSIDNASIYFDNAVEILSKFGDELIQRWEAVDTLANRASTNDIDQSEMAYRFTRIAELAGHYNAEKNWNHSKAIQSAIALSPTAGIAAVSRWRDRDIGEFQWNVNAMLYKLVQLQHINPLLAWDFTSFCSIESLQSLLKAYLKLDIIHIDQKTTILKKTINRLRHELTNSEYWYQLDILIKKNEIKSPDLEQILSQLPEPQQKKTNPENSKKFIPNLKWDEILHENDLLTPDGITAFNEALTNEAIKNEFHKGRHILFSIAFERLSDSDILKFFEALLQCNWLEYYDIISFFEHLPARTLNRPAIVKKIPEIITNIGRRFSLELTNKYGFNLIKKALPDYPEKTKYLKKGIFQGMINNQEFASSENLYNLANLAASTLTQLDAAEVLNYALERFEIHIDDNFGDGPWLPWANSTGDTLSSLASFLWSALGSPKSTTRWQAAHIVKELTRENGKDVFNMLFSNIEKNSCGAFGCQRYPFYYNHAIQFLLIACARISLDQPEFIKIHANEIAKLALDYEHLIIQKFAADTALRIADAFPDCYDLEQKDQLKRVGNCSFIQIDEYIDEEQDDFENDIEENDEGALDFHFGYDFSRYWLGELAEEFGLSQNEMVIRTASIIVNEWKLKADAYDNDPRVELWESQYNDFHTSHSHGSYPRDHIYNFYLSYHAMMIAGARLLKELRCNETDPANCRDLSNWLSSHLLTREDGYWMADWRDPLPLKRPSWENQDFLEWQKGISVSDIIHQLIITDEKKNWLAVYGGWEEHVNSKYETYSVRTALVKSETAESLLRALTTCSDPHNFKLPHYQERRMEIEKDYFQLKGWVIGTDLSPMLDQYDPFAEDLPFSLLEIGEQIQLDMNIIPSNNGKGYIKNNHNKELVIFSRQWSSSGKDQNKNPEQRGSRMNCSLDFLQEICRAKDIEIIFEVQVERNMTASYRSDRNIKRIPDRKSVV